MFDQLSIDDLAQHCLEENHKFKAHRDQDPAYCFELFRRALQDNVQEGLTRVYQIYQDQMLRWVRRQMDQSSIDLDEDAAYFLNLSLSNFYFALRGPTFSNFTSLASVLSYLKLCAFTAVSQYRRDHQKFTTTTLDENLRSPDEIEDPVVDSAALWAHLCELLPDSDDQLLVEWVFVQGMKPSEISKRAPDKWPTARAVTVDLQRIRRRLRGDDQLNAWFTGD